MTHNEPAEFTTQTVIDSETRRVFRKSAQAFIMNEAGLFLGCTPLGDHNATFLGTVQGGMEQGESEMDTLYREAQEEISINLRECATFVTAIVPKPDDGTDAAAFDDAAEDLARRPFRYASKSWRKHGVYGQQLCPSLFVAESSLLAACNLKPSDPKVPQEFKRAAWVSLASLSERAPPAKRAVMAAIHPFVYEEALAYLAAHHPDRCDQFKLQAAQLQKAANDKAMELADRELQKPSNRKERRSAKKASAGPSAKPVQN